MAKAYMSDRGLRPTHVYHQGPLASTLGTGWEHSPRCVSADEARGRAEAERILAEAESEEAHRAAMRRERKYYRPLSDAREMPWLESMRALTEALERFVSEEV